MKKTISLISILFLIQQFSYSQDQQLIDSLTDKLNRHYALKIELKNNLPAKYDTAAANILFEISKVYWYNNITKGIEFANKSLEISNQINYKKGITDSYYSLTTLYLNQGNDSLAMKYGNLTLKIAKETNDKYRIADTYANLGFLYYLKGNSYKAQTYCFDAIKLAETLKYPTCVILAYSNLGSVNLQQENYKDALKYYSLALDMAIKIDFKTQIAANYHNIGTVYGSTGNIEKALLFFFKALNVNRQTHNKLWEAYNSDAIGVMYEMQGKHAEALKYSLASADILNEIDEKVKLSMSYNNIGWTYFNIHDYKNAGISLHKSLKLALEVNYVDGLYPIYESLVSLDSATGNWKSAFENHKLTIMYHDSVINKENTKKTIEQAMQFDFDKKHLADSLKFLQEKEITSLKLDQQKKFTTGSLIGILVTIFLLIIVYRNYKKQQIANKKLKETQDQLISSEKMAAFGIMASRVAHEIQNPLNFVNNFSELSQDILTDLLESKNEKEKQENTEYLIDNLQKINDHGKRASAIVKQLQEHSKKGTAHEFFEPE